MVLEILSPDIAVYASGLGAWFAADSRYAGPVIRRFSEGPVDRSAVGVVTCPTAFVP